jgi:platelet-activating factor acetylhydrolase
MIFSHGLGGSRNAYSHFAGSLASHGVIVVCPEHRDGSAVVSFVRIPSEQDRFFVRNTRSVIPYNRIPHDDTPEVQVERNKQLTIRLWELGLVHEAILDIDLGMSIKNLNTSTPSMAPFAGKMHVQDPGSILFAGHSFGGATMVQFLKSTYYARRPELSAMKTPLFTPLEGSRLRKQVTEQNVIMLLDMWCFPLLSPDTSALFNLPLPPYADMPSAPGGSAILAVESEAFFKWKEHLQVMARVISPEPSASAVKPQAFERPSGIRLPEPNFFYVERSAHLSQSDFGILFPWLTKKIFNSVEPERALRLNLRAQLQLLRANNVPIARTWVGDLVDGAHVAKQELPGSKGDGNKGPDDGIHDDKAIFDRSVNNHVEFWHWVDSVRVGEGKNKSPSSIDEENETLAAEERDMETELEPRMETATVAPITAA